ncbi:hypothetical protein H5410_061317 [Solanum commersonii]|uniref:Uncharacterized protein n=1 Tax=Solanum commersonii TaxID=4109 RepID=A0A9J5W889_SOLCO|nr:hypothetical protein H5410_061317 [Solanum commersonii]
MCESKNGTNENHNTFVIDVVKNVEGLPMDLALNHDVDAALTTILLFGKQIGWTKTKRGNELNLATSILNIVYVFKKKLYYEATFSKEANFNDIGKLNRFVNPQKYATKCVLQSKMRR